MYYEIIPRNFVKIYGFKILTRTNEIISRNFIRIQKYYWNFRLFSSNFVNFFFSEKILIEVQENDTNIMEIYRNSVKISITD
jgi:hypothetical protein